jgi:hypothetical protein
LIHCRLLSSHLAGDQAGGYFPLSGRMIPRGANTAVGVTVAAADWQRSTAMAAMSPPGACPEATLEVVW